MVHHHPIVQLQRQPYSQIDIQGTRKAQCNNNRRVVSRRKVKRRRTTILKELTEAAAGGVAGRVPLPCLRGSCGGGESYICPRTRRRRSAQWGSRMVAHRGTAGEPDLKMAFCVRRWPPDRCSIGNQETADIIISVMQCRGSELEHWKR